MLSRASTVKVEPEAAASRVDDGSGSSSDGSCINMRLASEFL
jgi:hypothetical protein